jgi:DNA repair protein RadC
MTVKLTKKRKIKVLNGQDVYSIMQEVLMRESKIDRNKEHRPCAI